MQRPEWVQRFSARIQEAIGDNLANEEVIAAELESWPIEGDWAKWEPEEAADENLSYWGADDGD